MINHLIGNYLVDSGCLTSLQLERVFEIQKKTRARLGLIAVSEKMLTSKQSEEINKLQQIKDGRFGDIAIEKGYLTDAQVARLLELQGNSYMSFVQAVIDSGFMSLPEYEAAFYEYRKCFEYTLKDLEAIISDDSDKIVPLFLPDDCEELQVKHILTAVRMLLRLIDSEIYVERASRLSKLEDISGIAIQSIVGTYNATLGISGVGDSILIPAEIFAQEKFDKVETDALDSVAEFINCVNGVYLSGNKSNADMDMLPPEYICNPETLNCSDMVVLPVFLKGSKLYLISKFDGTINL